MGSHPTSYDGHRSESLRSSPGHSPGLPDGIGSYRTYSQPASAYSSPTNQPYPSPGRVPLHGDTPPAIQKPDPSLARSSGIPSGPSPFGNGGQYHQGGNVPNNYNFGGRPGSLSNGTSTSGSHNLPEARPSFQQPSANRQDSPAWGARLPADGYNSGGRPGSMESGTSTFESRRPLVAHPHFPSPQDSFPSDARLPANAVPPDRTASISCRDTSNPSNNVRKVVSYSLMQRIRVRVTAGVWVFGVFLGLGGSISKVTGKPLYLVEFEFEGRYERRQFSDDDLQSLNT